MVHRLYSESAGAIAADGESTLVLFDYLKQRPMGIPAELREAIGKLEGGQNLRGPGRPR